MSVTCDKSVVSSGSSDFLHQNIWPPQYKWNIVGSCVKHHQANNQDLLIGFCVSHLFSFLFCLFVFCCLNSLGVLVIIMYVQPCCRVDFNAYLGLRVCFNILVLIMQQCTSTHVIGDPRHHLTVLFPSLLVANCTDLGIFDMYQFYATFRWFYIQNKTASMM